MRKAPTTELPPDMALAAAGTDLSEADRGLMVVWSRPSGEEGQASFAEALHGYRSGEADRAFDRLPADAGEEVRRDVAERLLPGTREFLAANPGLSDPRTLDPDAAGRAPGALGSALRDLYNPAQLDVLRRIGRLLEAAPEDGGRS